VTLCNVAVGYQRLEVTSVHPEDEGSMDLWNVGILPQHNIEDHGLKHHRRESLKPPKSYQLFVDLP